MREGFKGSRAPFANSLISMQAERGERARAREKAISSLQTLEAKFFELFPRAVAKLQSMGCFYVYFAQQRRPNRASSRVAQTSISYFPPILTGFLSRPPRLSFFYTSSFSFLVHFCTFFLQHSTSMSREDGPRVPRKAFTFPFRKTARKRKPITQEDNVHVVHFNRKNDRKFS